MNEIIYVNVLGFPDGLLTPVQGVKKHGVCYELLEESEDPEHDHWEFTKGEVVSCEKVQFGEGEFGLVAKQCCTCS